MRWILQTAQTNQTLNVVNAEFTVYQGVGGTELYLYLRSDNGMWAEIWLPYRQFVAEKLPGKILTLDDGNDPEAGCLVASVHAPQAQALNDNVVTIKAISPETVSLQWQANSATHHFHFAGDVCFKGVVRGML